MLRVLFVCLGNICRSPTADGVFRALVAEQGLAHRVASGSAGISDYHQGEPPDPRAVAAARRRGIDLVHMRARQVVPADFRAFDFLLAMDRMVFARLSALRRQAGAEAAGRLQLFLDHAPELGLREVPDPYEGGDEGFDAVFELIEAGARGLLDAIRREGLV